MLKILELFGGIGSPRVALRNMGIPVTAIYYAEIDEKAVRSYNAIFNSEPRLVLRGSPPDEVEAFLREIDEEAGNIAYHVINGGGE